MKQNRQEKGLAHLGLIIVAVIVVAAVAFGGWYVWQKNKDDKKDSNSSNTNQTNNQSNNDTNTSPTSKRFNCKGIFTIAYPDSLQATLTDAQQCLISNVSVDEMPPVGPLPSEQLGLFFSVQTTSFTTSKEYLGDYIERSQEDSALELKSQQEIKLDNATNATLASLYGGHPTQHDFYFFVYVKDGKAITTSYPIDSNHKEVALEILKSIE